MTTRVLTLQEIYEEFGACSRCQLGVLIATSGILDAEAVPEHEEAAAG